MAKAARIARWGNSLAVRIPREAAERAGLEAGDPVAISAISGKLTVARKRPEYRIEELVRKMKPENRHKSIDWGPPRGQEFW